jgi:hypothetical protein
MPNPRTAAFAGLAALGLCCAASTAIAQSPTRERVIEVRPGTTVIIVPAGASLNAAPVGAMFDSAFPAPAMPDPAAMFREVDAMMNRMERAFAMPAWTDPARTWQAGMHTFPAGEGLAGVVVTSVSDGRGTCTQRITYRGNGAAPIVNVSGTGGACAALGAPAGSRELSVPAVSPRLPEPAAPPHAVRTWEVQNRVRSAPQSRPVDVAYLGD